MQTNLIQILNLIALSIIIHVEAFDKKEGYFKAAMLWNYAHCPYMHHKFVST